MPRNYAPGNHIGPNRDDKGRYMGSCNVTACQLPDSAYWFNHSTQRYYCKTCAAAINEANPPRSDSFMRRLGHDLCTYHPPMRPLEETKTGDFVDPALNTGAPIVSG